MLVDKSPLATLAVDAEPGAETDAGPRAVSATGRGLAPASRGVATRPPAPEDLHPALWRASQVGRVSGGIPWRSGFAALDAELPGGGWPARALTELLLPQPGIGEMRLLAPVLAASARGAMLFDPPERPCGWALAALGLDLRQWVLVHGREHLRAARATPPAADILWALEQALASGQAGVVLAWLPAAPRTDALRRLQLAAQSHDAPVFVLRPAQARLRPSVAPLRLLLAPAGPDELRVQILKRRGPPLAQAIRLALPPVLAPAARAKALRQAPRRAGEVAVVAAADAVNDFA